MELLVHQTSFGVFMSHSINNTTTQSYRITNHHKINILQWNVDGLKSKKQYIQHILDHHNIHVAALQEARKTSQYKTVPLPLISGYKGYGDVYGRTVIYIKNDIVHNYIPHNILPNKTNDATNDFKHTLWTTWIRIKGKASHKDLVIGSAYKPNDHCKEYAASDIIDDIQEIAKHYYASNTNKFKLVCCADFNITHEMLAHLHDPQMIAAARYNNTRKDRI
eukprot:748356_1